MTTHIDPFSSAATHFDYLIAGGGTAGLTLAARLTEDPDITVGVFEVGYVYLKNDHSFLVLRFSRKTCFGNQSRCQLSRPVLQLNYLP